MTQTSKPSKELVRALMQRRQQERTPPATPEQIRRELGWEMLRQVKNGSSRG